MKSSGAAVMTADAYKGTLQLVVSRIVEAVIMSLFVHSEQVQSETAKSEDSHNSVDNTLPSTGARERGTVQPTESGKFGDAS